MNRPSVSVSAVASPASHAGGHHRRPRAALDDAADERDRLLRRRRRRRRAFEHEVVAVFNLHGGRFSADHRRGELELLDRRLGGWREPRVRPGIEHPDRADRPFLVNHDRERDGRRRSPPRRRRGDRPPGRSASGPAVLPPAHRRPSRAAGAGRRAGRPGAPRRPAVDRDAATARPPVQVTGPRAGRRGGNPSSTGQWTTPRSVAMPRTFRTGGRPPRRVSFSANEGLRYKAPLPPARRERLPAELSRPLQSPIRSPKWFHALFLSWLASPCSAPLCSSRGAPSRRARPAPPATPASWSAAGPARTCRRTTRTAAPAGRVCRVGTDCQAGECTCSAGIAMCGNACVDVERQQLRELREGLPGRRRLQTTTSAVELQLRATQCRDGAVQHVDRLGQLRQLRHGLCRAARPATAGRAGAASPASRIAARPASTRPPATATAAAAATSAPAVRTCTQRCLRDEPTTGRRQHGERRQHRHGRHVDGRNGTGTGGTGTAARHRQRRQGRHDRHRRHGHRRQQHHRRRRGRPLPVHQHGRHD